MKKILFTAIGIISCVGVASAADLDETLKTIGASMSLSSGVVGTYFSGTNNANYTLSTKNSKGTKAYATSSTVTKIYYKVCEAQPCASQKDADLLKTSPTDDASATEAVTDFGYVLGGT